MFKNFKERILEFTFDIENVLIAIHSSLAQPNFNYRVMDHKAGLKIPHAITQIVRPEIGEFNRIARKWVSKLA